MQEKRTPPARTPAMGRLLGSLLGFANLASAVISCSGDGVGLTDTGDLPGSGPGTGFASVQPVFDTNCVRCHAPGGIGYLQTGGDQQNGLDLTPAASWASTVGQSTFESPDVPPRWRVLPGEPDSSYLIQKLVSDSPKFGSRMPFDGPPFLSSSDVELIRAWIENGAQP